MARKRRFNKTFFLLVAFFFLFVLMAVFDVGGLFSTVTSVGGAGSGLVDEYNPLRDGCYLLGVSSVRNALAELGVDEYYRLTTNHRLVTVDGVVYACK